MNTAVTYYSRTGNNRKLADAIAHAAGCTAAAIQEFKAAPVDLLIIGGSVYGGALDPALVDFITGLDPQHAKRAVLFTTCITRSHAIHFMKDLLQSKGIPVEDTFSCKGKFLFFNMRHPDKNDLCKAEEFATSLISREQP